MSAFYAVSMISRTTISATRALIYLARVGGSEFQPPRRIAEELRESPTYMAKVVRRLVKAGMLRVEKGSKGGVRLIRPPTQVTLLAIVEACQGTIVGDYCQTNCDLAKTCAYHRAAVNLHQAIVRILTKWSLADLIQAPYPRARTLGGVPCVLTTGTQRRTGATRAVTPQ